MLYEFLLRQANPIESLGVRGGDLHAGLGDRLSQDPIRQKRSEWGGFYA